MDEFSGAGESAQASNSQEAADVDVSSNRAILYSPVKGKPIADISPDNLAIQKSPYLFVMTLPASCFKYGNRGFCYDLADQSNTDGVHAMNRIFDMIRLISYAAYSKKIFYQRDTAQASAVPGEVRFSGNDESNTSDDSEPDSDGEDDDSDEELLPRNPGRQRAVRPPTRLVQAPVTVPESGTVPVPKAKQVGVQDYTLQDGTPRLSVYIEILVTTNGESFAGLRVWMTSTHRNFDLGSLCRDALNKSGKANDPMLQTMKPVHGTINGVGGKGKKRWCEFTLNNMAHVFSSYLRMCKVHGDIHSTIANKFRPDDYNSPTHISNVFSVENAFSINLPDVCPEQKDVSKYFGGGGFVGYPRKNNVSLVNLAHIVTCGFETVPIWCFDTKLQEERTRERNRKAFQVAFWNDETKMRRGMSAEMCALITHCDDRLSDDGKEVVGAVRLIISELVVVAQATMYEAVKDTQYTGKRRSFIDRSDNLRLHVVYERLKRLITNKDLTRFVSGDDRPFRDLLRFHAQMWALERFWDVIVNGDVPGPLDVVRREFVNLPPHEQLSGYKVPFNCTDLTDYGNFKHKFYEWYETLGVHTAHGVAYTLHGAMACAGSPNFDAMLPHIELTGDPGAGKSDVSQRVADNAPQVTSITDMTAKSLSIGGDHETGRVFYFTEAPKELRGSKKDVDNQSSTLLSMMSEGAINVKAYNMDAGTGKRDNMNFTAMMRSMVVVCNNKPTEKGTAIHDRLQQIHMARRHREGKSCGLNGKAPAGIPLGPTQARIASLLYRMNSINVIFWLAEQSVLPACEQVAVESFIDRLKSVLSEEIGHEYVANDRAVMSTSMLAISYQRLLAQAQEIGSESGRVRWRETDQGEKRGFNHLSLWYASQRCAVRSEVICDAFTMFCDKFIPTEVEKIAAVILKGLDKKTIAGAGVTTEFGARLWSDVISGRTDIVPHAHDNSYVAFQATKGTYKMIDEYLKADGANKGEANVKSILRDSESRNIYVYPNNTLNGELVEDTLRERECMSLVKKKVICVSDTSSRQVWYTLIHVDILQYCGLPLAKRIVKRVFEYSSLSRPRLQPLSFPRTMILDGKRKNLYQFFDISFIRPDPESSDLIFNNPLTLGASTKLAIGGMLDDLVEDGTITHDADREETLQHGSFVMDYDIDMYSTVLMLDKLGLEMTEEEMQEIAFGFSSGATNQTFEAAALAISAGTSSDDLMDIEGPSSSSRSPTNTYINAIKEEEEKITLRYYSSRQRTRRRRGRTTDDAGGGGSPRQRARISNMSDHFSAISGIRIRLTPTRRRQTRVELH